MPRLPTDRYPDWPRRMTSRQAEAYCNATAAALKAAGVPYTRQGNADYWDRHDLDAWVDSQFGKREGRKVENVRALLDDRFGEDDAA